MSETLAAQRARDGRHWPAWLALIALTLVLGALPQMLGVSDPDGTLAIGEAQFSIEQAAPQAVALPHTWPAAPLSTAHGTYRLHFSGAGLPGGPLLLFVPAARHDIAAFVNGEQAIKAFDDPWGSPASGYAYLAHIPEGAIKPGDNEIELRQTRDLGWLPGRLSRVYIGPDETVLPAYRLSNFFIEQTRTMTLALHIVLAIGIVTIWTVRRHDPVFQWLAAMAVASLLVIVSQSPMAATLGALVQLQFAALMSSIGLMSIGLAIALAGWAMPRALVPAILILPLALFALGQAGLVPVPTIGLASAAIAIAAYAVAAMILFLDFGRRGDWDAAILAVPCALTAWFGLHDVLVVTGHYDSPFLLVSFVRIGMLVAIMVILMGRLARSLNGLDDANENLRRRLDAREAQLMLMHEKERNYAEEMARETERQRLMQDLHDGLSGHLVSIIALSENTDADRAAIEASAREALNDLRLVIQSLDIGDRDLPVALAGFRERLAPQLRRLGVSLDWSTQAMPEVSGVTPSNALTILRIVQEAVTNALKHGPASAIRIGGARTADGVHIFVENDRRGGVPPGKGRGMANMQRRARSLGGAVALDLEPDRARLVLYLPPRLPEGTA